MRSILSSVLGVAVLALAGCTSTQQNAAAGFKPPEGNYKLVVMRPDIKVSLLTTGGSLEPREDWTTQARANVMSALGAQQAIRGGKALVVANLQDVGADAAMVVELGKLHEVVGRAIQLHKYVPALALPTKKNSFDWTLGERAVEYGRSTGNDYALFLYAEDSFSSGGRVALQAVSMLGCLVGVCVLPAGGHQVAFASLVDLRSGNVVWYNYLFSEVGDIREQKGAEQLVEKLLGSMKAAKSPGKG